LVNYNVIDEFGFIFTDIDKDESEEFLSNREVFIVTFELSRISTINIEDYCDNTVNEQFGNPSGSPCGNPSGSPCGNPSGSPCGNPSGSPCGNPSGSPCGNSQIYYVPKHLTIDLFHT
jgi:hypothetical protein